MRYYLPPLIAIVLLAACAAPLRQAQGTLQLRGGRPERSAAKLKDARRSVQGAATPPTLAWQYTAALPFTARAAAGGGLVVIAPGGETIVALAAADGAILWEYKGKVHPRSLVVGDGLIFAGTPGGGLIALDAASGELRWQTALVGDAVYPPALRAGRLYAATSFVGPGLEPRPGKHGWLYAIQAADGQTLWARETNAYLLVTPAVDEMLLIAGGSFRGAETDEGGHMRLVALAPDDGRELWQYDSEDGLLKSLAFDEARVYYLAYRDTLFALDRADGQPLWNYDTENWSPGFAFADGTLYFGSDNAFVHAVAGADGSQLWRVHLEGVFNAPRAEPLIDGGRLYFQSNDESIYALDRATGQIVWQTPPQVRSRVGLALADGLLYLVGTDNTLYAYALTP